MLKRSIYTLLVVAIALNIGAGIWYNGIPGIFDSPRDSIMENDEAASGMLIPPSRVGDIYTTSYNMSLDYRVEDEQKEEEGTFQQEGTVTRSMGADMIVQGLTGIFDLRYNKTGAPELKIYGDIKRTRTTFRETETEGWEEDIETTMMATTSIKKQRQASDLKVHLNRPQQKWSDRILYDLKQTCGPLNASSGGTLTNSLSIDEIGSFLPEVSLEWSARPIPDPNGPSSYWVDISSTDLDGLEIECSLRFSKDSPHPLETDLQVSKVHESSSGVTYLDLRIKESLLDHFSGDGELMGEMDIWSYRNPENPAESVSGDLLPQKGSGDTAFWSSPQEVFDHSTSNSQRLQEFISDCGLQNLGCRRITYMRNESLPGTMRDWNITLGSDPETASGDGYYIKVATPHEVGAVSRRWKEISDEGKLFDAPSSRKSRDVITLQDFETSLRSSVHSDRMFVGSEHSSTFGMEMIRRGSDGKKPYSSLLNSALGLERASEKDIFIGHVQDRGDPLKLYVVVVDGRDGAIISTAEIEGLATFLINRYGLDLA
ncbi:MAG: hypothetical protein R6V01_02095 [Thermoplasmatota archaeon]